MRRRWLICGSRDWADVDYIDEVMNDLINPKKDSMIHGGADGADCIAEMVAYIMGMPGERIIRVNALWLKHGKAAGPIRNSKMLTYDPTDVLAFHPYLPNSKGTKDMVTKAKEKGIPVTVFAGRGRI